jgi:single-strand selective monofunctional uracil DNA glycosylase
VKSLAAISRDLSAKVSRLRFGEPIAYVYNPLEHARAPHEAYLDRYGTKSPRDALFLGMNPGPFGMAQTGVPFGDVAMVRDFLGITGAVSRPSSICPQRPIDGFACTRSEVSGTRFWGLARDHWGTADRFFERFFVANWCPLVFMESGGRNVTPDKLRAAEREPLYAACDEALVRIADALRPSLVIGVGGFAQKRAEAALGESGPRIGCILHPSPASPAANRNWAETALGQLRDLGVPPPR